MFGFLKFLIVNCKAGEDNLMISHFILKFLGSSGSVLYSLNKSFTTETFRIYSN